MASGIELVRSVWGDVRELWATAAGERSGWLPVALDWSGEATFLNQGQSPKTASRWRTHVLVVVEHIRPRFHRTLRRPRPAERRCRRRACVGHPRCGDAITAS
jgi:hypothetical protein